jgi:hypothetical protein
VEECEHDGDDDRAAGEGHQKREDETRGTGAESAASM